MKTYDKIIESFAVLFDPSQPDRKPAFDVHVITMIDLEDGSPAFMDPRQPRRVLNVTQAKAAGFDLPEIAAALETDAMADLVSERGAKAEVEAARDAAHEELNATKVDLAKALDDLKRTTFERDEIAKIAAGGLSPAWSEPAGQTKQPAAGISK